MKPGDRVKLTPKAAATMLKGKNSGMYRKVKVNWRTRRGTIVRFSRTATIVKWDNRASLDLWPESALEVQP